jgi:long-chain acyl-CoA synthetase
MLPNRPRFPIGYFATLRTGAIVIATSAICTVRETAHQWRDAGSTVAIIDRALASVARAVQRECPEL